MTTNFERNGEEILVNTTTIGDQQAPDMTWLGSGGFVVVWQDSSGLGGDPNPSIKAQLFDADGNKNGLEFLVNSVVALWQSSPKVTALQSGGFVVSWVDDIDSHDVKAQIFSPAGVKVGSEFLVNTTTVTAQDDPNITALASGGFVVTWTDGSQTSSDMWPYSVKGQVFDSSGAKVGGEFLVNTTTDKSQSDPAVAGLPSGGFVVTWEDNSESGTDSSDLAIKAQLFASNGSKVGTEFLVNVATDGDQKDPAVASLASGGFVVTWTDVSGGVGVPASFDLKARIFDANGDPIGSEFLVNSTVFGTQWAADVTALSSGGFLVTWTDDSRIGGDDEASAIKGQQFDATGQKVGIEFLVNTVTATWQFDPTIVSLAGGGFAIAWVHQNAAGTLDTMNVKAQVFVPSSGPSDISLSTSNVSETAVENLAIATISSSGPVTASFTYSLLSDSTGGAFGIDGDKLIVVDNGKLDFETAPNVTVTIRSTDNLGNHYDEAMVLSVTNALHEVRYTTGETIQVNTNHDAGSDQLSVARLASGGSVVVWQDWGDEGSASKAQLLDPQGNPVGSEFLVGGVDDPSVAGGQEGGFIVCWTASDPSENLPGTAIVWDVNHTRIMAQLFDANGQKVGEQFLVNTEDQGQQLHGSVAALDGGGYVVTWVDTDSSGPSGAGIKAQLLNAAGAKVGSEFLVNTSSSSSVFSAPRVAVAASGDFVITWENLNDDIKAQLFDSTGTRIGSEISVNAVSGEFGTYPVVAALGSGGFVIAWIGFDGVGNVLKGQILDAEGNKLGSEFLISDANGEYFQGPSSITPLDTGGFVATWGYLESRFAQVFDADGNKVGDSILIGSTPFSFAPVLTALSGDGFMIAWAEAVEGGFEIDARVFHLVDNRIGTFDVDTLIGDGADNGIYAFAGNDALTGGAGQDRLDGGTGADTMSGGADNDTYVVDNAGDTVTENADEGTDTVETSLGVGANQPQRIANKYQLGANIENLTGTALNQGLQGNAHNNEITAGAGADYVDASDGGSDTINTNDGRDVIYYGASLDSTDANDAGDEGGDARGDVLVIQGNYDLTLGADALIDVEKFRIQKGEFTGWGDTAGNLYSYDITTVDANVAAGLRIVVQGGSLQLGEHLRFDGAAESDGSFQMFGGHDSDELIGGAQGDHLLGRSGDDILTGNGGADRLRGGLGADTMDGGAGADIFVYAAQAGTEPYANAVLESTGLSHDTIIGFDFAEDKIDLPGAVSSFDNDVTGTLNSATFDADLASAVNGSLAANGAVLFTADNGDQSDNIFLVIDADGNGSYQADVDFVIELVGAVGTVPASPDFFM